jgi:hypothetical protein
MNKELFTPSIEHMLDMLADLKARRDLTAMSKKQLIDEAIPAEVAAKIAQIETDFNAIVAGIDSKTAELEAEIKAKVLAGKKTEHGQFLMAVYVKGRSGGYDTTKLDGMAAIIPQILQAKKPDGEPTVSFRAVGK